MIAAPPLLTARRAHTTELDARQALSGLRRGLNSDAASAVLLYCSGNYDFTQLGALIKDTFASPVIACTAGAQIGAGGFETGGITGISLQSEDLSMHPHLLSPLSRCQPQALQVARDHAARSKHRPSIRSFGILLVDGTSGSEETVASALYESLGDVPVVGGSASPPASSDVAAVYHDGRFERDAAVIALFQTTALHFTTFEVQHFVPSDKKLVITLADPTRRLVYEINGEPAARSYARALGLDPARLTAAHFAAHPLMLDLGDRRLPRAIRAVGDEGSLLMACAVEEGSVLSIADSDPPLTSFRTRLQTLNENIHALAALLVFDSDQHRQQLAAQGLDTQVGAMLAAEGAVGFSGYGAQLGPLHTNHTLTGIALGVAAKGDH